MQKPTPDEMQKMGVVFGILFILLIGFLVIRMRSTGKTAAPPQNTNMTQNAGPTVIPKRDDKTGVMGIEPDQVKTKPGETFRVNIYFQSGGKNVYGADAVLNYDPNFLSVNEIIPGGVFKEYPSQKIDQNSGTVKVTGFELIPYQDAVNKPPFFSISFTAGKAGETSLTLIFQKERTNLSTIVEAGTSRNILGTVYPAKIIIRQ